MYYPQLNSERPVSSESSFCRRYLTLSRRHA